MECLVFLLFSSALLMVTNASPSAGPFDVTFTNAAYCTDPWNGVAYDMKVMKVSRKKLILALNLSFTVPLDDELGVLVNMAKQTNQGWKENFFILESPKACTVLKSYVPVMERELSQQMKMESGHCPYPVGNYSGLTVALQIDVRVFPVFTYGKYQAKVNLMKNHKRIFCIHGFIDIVPKKSG